MSHPAEFQSVTNEMLDERIEGLREMMVSANADRISHAAEDRLAHAEFRLAIASQPPAPPGILYRLGTLEGYQENQKVWAKRIVTFLTGGSVVGAFVSWRYLDAILDALKALKVP